MRSLGLTMKSPVGPRRSSKVILEPTKDLALLRRVRDCRFITSYQLFEYAKVSDIARSLGSFYWRIGRLVECGLVQTVTLQIGKYRIYTITRQGLRELENRQECLLSLTSSARFLAKKDEIPHALLLNDIRRTFEQQFSVKWWRTDLQVRAANLAARNYAKDYDAVLSVDRSDGGQNALTIAVEYERTLKAEDRYSEISNALSVESSIDILFYLCASADMVPLLAQRISLKNLLLGFTVARSFVNQGKQCLAFLWTQKKLQPIPMVDIINTFNRPIAFPIKVAPGMSLE
jgi:DNA-binding PadR family transcriptional regulator